MDQLIYIIVFSVGTMVFGGVVFFFFAREDMIPRGESKSDVKST